MKNFKLGDIERGGGHAARSITISAELSNGTTVSKKIKFNEITLDSKLGSVLTVFEMLKEFDKLEKKSEKSV